MQTPIAKTANTAQTPTSHKLWTKTNHSNLPSRALSVLALLGASMANAGIDTNTGGASETTTTSRIVPSNIVNVKGFSFTPEDGNYDFKVIFTQAEMVWLNNLKTDAATGGYTTKAAAGPLLMPVAAFDICVDSNLEVFANGGVQLKASVAAGNFEGEGDTTNNLIPSYVLLHGNGNANTTDNAAKQDLLFGTAATTVQGFMNTTAITQANKTLVTSTASTYAEAFEDGNTPWVKNGMTAINMTNTGAKINGSINGSTATAIDHYGIAGTGYGLATSANDTTNNAFQVDVTEYAANNCGTGNVAIVNAILYLDVRSLIGMPADTYNASIGIDFSIA